MFNHFKELMKSLDVYSSLFYVFNIPFSIINFNEVNQLRKKRPVVKYFLKVIEYYLESEKIIVKNNIHYSRIDKEKINRTRCLQSYLLQ